VIEQWDDDAALAVHFTQPWISEFAVKYLTRMKASTVQVYDIAGIRPLPGM
jgi:quinol monooxygenase YgiN